MRVVRFAISPEILQKPIGTHLKVARLNPKTLELLPMNQTFTPKEEQGEQVVAADRQKLQNFNPNHPAVTRRQD